MKRPGDTVILTRIIDLYDERKFYYTVWIKHVIVGGCNMETYFKLKLLFEYYIPLGVLALIVIGFIILLFARWCADRVEKINKRGDDNENWIIFKERNWWNTVK